jgi:hypothetical protein
MADIAITAANVLGSSTAVRLTQYKAGEAITAGQPVYLNSSSQWIKLDINAASTGNGITDVRGIAENSAPASGQPLSVVTEDSDFTVGGTLTNGSALYGSTTAGGITHDVPGSGSYPVYIGQAKSTTKAVINFNASGAVI